MPTFSEYLGNEKKKKHLREGEEDDTAEMQDDESTPADEGQDALDAENEDEEYDGKDNEEIEAEFDELLDEEGDVEIGGISFRRSRILKELDPIAYDEALNNYLDSKE